MCVSTGEFNTIGRYHLHSAECVRDLCRMVGEQVAAGGLYGADSEELRNLLDHERAIKCWSGRC